MVESPGTRARFRDQKPSTGPRRADSRFTSTSCPSAHPDLHLAADTAPADGPDREALRSVLQQPGETRRPNDDDTTDQTGRN